MKNPLIVFFFISITTLLYSQDTKKTLDIIYLTNGDIIKTRIIRVNNRKFYYTDPITYDISEISRKKVSNYEFNDDFFQTNLLGKLDHREVVRVDGYSKEEIYRAIKDWFLINARRFGNGIFLEDTTHRIIMGSVSSAEYLKMDFVTVLTMVSDEDPLQTYSLVYDVNVRIKDNRFKIYTMNFEINGNSVIYEKALFRSYEKRKTKDGINTIHATEIKELKDMISHQINQIKKHCEIVRQNDTYHNRVVKQALEDDDW